MKVYTSNGKIIEIGSKLGSGGEGSVFEVTNLPNIVAKIYHSPIDKDKALKIKAMAAMKNERLLKIAAWPIDTLHKNVNGQVIGLLMPRVSEFKEIHKLYGPKTRLNEFPNAGWSFLIHTASNLARAFGVIHENGHVIGDVNHGNVVVSERATVMLIDCDSFQITYNKQKLLCEVGVSTHQPPEFQDLKSFRGVIRTPNHDNFGLAVLIFQILFIGRHPFSGSYLGTGEMPLEKAIKEFRFSYGAFANTKQMRQPPNTLSLNAVTPKISALFERAFSQEGIRDNTRPTPKEWVAALDELNNELKKCSNNNGHVFIKSLHSCPWCDIERKIGILLFNFSATITINDKETFNLSLVWTQITQIKSPGQSLVLTKQVNYTVKPDDSLKKYSLEKKIRSMIALLFITGITVGAGFVFGFGGGFLGFVISGFIVPNISKSADIDKVKSDVDNAFSLAQNKLRQLEGQWNHEASDREFRDKINELTNVKQEYLELSSLRERKLKMLDQERKKHQLERFLDGYDLNRAIIDGIGPGRKATLQSYGIQTAADIDKYAIMKIQGFGPVYTGNLIAWRQSIEKKFVFNPKLPVDASKVTAIENEIKALKVKYERILLNGANELKQISNKILYRRQALTTQYENLRREFLQAQENKKYL